MNGSKSSPRRTRWVCAPPRPFCTVTSSGRFTGRVTCCACDDFRRAAGGSPNSCRSGSCTWRRPLWRKGRTRSGPTFREAVLMHAVPRLVLHPLIINIQTSWVKMGAAGAALCLNAGANDLGGTLMNESITRAAGGVHGQELDAAQLQALARRMGRRARQRNTLYGSLDGAARPVACAHRSPPRRPALDARRLTSKRRSRSTAETGIQSFCGAVRAERIAGILGPRRAARF